MPNMSSSSRLQRAARHGMQTNVFGFTAIAIVLGSTEHQNMYWPSPQFQSFSAPPHANKCIWLYRNCIRSRLHSAQTNVFGLTAIAIILGATACKQMYLASPQLQSFSAPPHANKCIWLHRNCNPSRLHRMQTNVLALTAIPIVLGSTACK